MPGFTIRSGAVLVLRAGAFLLAVSVAGGGAAAQSCRFTEHNDYVCDGGGSGGTAQSNQVFSTLDTGSLNQSLNQITAQGVDVSQLISAYSADVNLSSIPNISDLGLRLQTRLDTLSRLFDYLGACSEIADAAAGIVTRRTDELGAAITQAGQQGTAVDFDSSVLVKSGVEVWRISGGNVTVLGESAGFCLPLLTVNDSGSDF